MACWGSFLVYSSGRFGVCWDGSSQYYWILDWHIRELVCLLLYIVAAFFHLSTSWFFVLSVDFRLSILYSILTALWDFSRAYWMWLLNFSFLSIMTPRYFRLGDQSISCVPHLNFLSRGICRVLLFVMNIAWVFSSLSEVIKITYEKLNSQS